MHLCTGADDLSEARGLNALKLELEDVVSHITRVLRIDLSLLEERQVLLTSAPSSPGPRLETLNCKFSLHCVHVCMRAHVPQYVLGRSLRHDMCLFLMSPLSCCPIPFLLLLLCSKNVTPQPWDLGSSSALCCLVSAICSISEGVLGHKLQVPWT